MNRISILVCRGPYILIYVYLFSGPSLTIFFLCSARSEFVPLDPRCALVLDQGPCRDYKMRWYYDKQANACAQFWYGACEGNQNRFNTEEECKRTCVQERAGIV